MRTYLSRIPDSPSPQIYGERFLVVRPITDEHSDDEWDANVQFVRNSRNRLTRAPSKIRKPVLCTSSTTERENVPSSPCNQCPQRQKCPRWKMTTRWPDTTQWRAPNMLGGFQIHNVLSPSRQMSFLQHRWHGPTSLTLPSAIAAARAEGPNCAKSIQSAQYAMPACQSTPNPCSRADCNQKLTLGWDWMLGPFT